MKARATAARQDALREWTLAQSRVGRNRIKIGLFASAEAQRQLAEAAYQAGDYARAKLYFSRRS